MKKPSQVAGFIVSLVITGKQWFPLDSAFLAGVRCCLVRYIAAVPLGPQGVAVA